MHPEINEKAEEKRSIKHIAIIPDGNLRWAMANSFSPIEAYQQGSNRLEEMLYYAIKYNIDWLTIYVLSEENILKRDEKDIKYLFDLLIKYLTSNKEAIMKNNCVLKVMGKIKDLNLDLQQNIQTIVDLTSTNSGMNIVLAINYSGQEEIINASYQMSHKNQTLGSQESFSFKDFLYIPEMPEIDLLIRTGGESRISNFCLWYLSYAELLFYDKLWPDFKEEDFSKCLGNFFKRTRNFGQSRYK